MAIELCEEKSSSVGVGSNSTTPRISFSYDFLQSDVVPIEQRPLRSNSSGLNSTIDFDFCVRHLDSYDHEPSSADELFSDGKILPTEIKKKSAAETPPKSAQPDQETTQPLSQSFSQSPGAREENNTSSSKKSFWHFKRSSSCGAGGYGRTLCPLPLLSRSNSTGSADETKPINIKRSPLSKEKEGSSSSKQSNNNSSHKSHSSPNGNSYQKPPLKKSLGAYGNGVTINPVLNVSPANLFAMGSMFSNGKNKAKKK